MNPVELNPDRLLDEVVARIRELEVPARPRELGDSLPRLAPTRFFGRRLVQTAAVLLVVALLGAFWIALPLGSGQSAFAQMQEALAAMKTLSCRRLDFSSDGNCGVTKYFFSGDSLSRVDSPDELTILNFSEGARMIAIHKNRTAVIDPLYPAPDYLGRQADFLNTLWNVPESSIKQIGERMLDGRAVIDFLVNLENRDQKVTVDAKTKLPIQIDLGHFKRLDGEETRQEVTHFVFDEPIDASLFSIEAPAGYEVTDHRPKSVAPPQIDDRELLVSPEVGIGPAKFGASVLETIHLLGKPDWQDRHEEAGHPPYTDLNYASRGFELKIDHAKGLATIKCYSQDYTPTVRDFHGKTKEGIRMGATFDEVLKTYGDTTPKVVNSILPYYKRGWCFFFRKGKLSVIQIDKAPKK